MQREYRVLYQEVEDGWIMASVPDLPGAVTQGRDRDEARMMIREAVELLLESYRDHAVQDSSDHAQWETMLVEVPTA